VKKLRVGVVFGGRSGEHEVSKLSGQNVTGALEEAGFSVVPIFIDKKGRWSVDKGEVALLPTPGRGLHYIATQKSITVDIFFPVLHGPYGEDGTIQGLFEMAGVPYVGAGVLGSAIGMDKEAQKLLYLFHGIPTPQFEVVRLHEWHEDREKIERVAIARVGLPCFVKPANLGSSVGVTKVKKAERLRRAIEEAFQYDTKILVEESIRGREVFCGVIGNEEPRVSLPGEVIPHREFYDYFAKYVSDKTELKVPIPLSRNLHGKVMEFSAAVYRVTFGEGYARVDFFLTADEDLSVIEINTIPGFTSHSMFPKAWEASGLPLPELVKTLVELGLDRYKIRRRLKTTSEEGRLLE